jgi:hypothetical protein
MQAEALHIRYQASSLSSSASPHPLSGRSADCCIWHGFVVGIKSAVDGQSLDMFLHQFF